jgi:hypothetical protein
VVEPAPVEEPAPVDDAPVVEPAPVGPVDDNAPEAEQLGLF